MGDESERFDQKNNSKIHKILLFSVVFPFAFNGKKKVYEFWIDPNIEWLFCVLGEKTEWNRNWQKCKIAV